MTTKTKLSTQKQIDAVALATASLGNDGELLPVEGAASLFLRRGVRWHTYVVNCRVRGVQRRIKVGDTRSLSLKDAIEAGKKIASQIVLGEDPALQKAARKAAKTFGEFVPEFIRDQKEEGRAASYLSDVARTLEVYAKPLHAVPVKDVTRGDIVEIVNRVKRKTVDGEERKAPANGAARLAHAHLSSFFGWLLAHDAVAHNPALGAKRPDKGAPRDRTLSEAEIGVLWQEVGEAKDDWSRIVAVLLLTGCRKSEIAELRTDELDLSPFEHRDGQGKLLAKAPGVIRFDKDRIKTRNRFLLPLSDEAHRILSAAVEKRGKGEAYVFGKLPGRPFSGDSKSHKALTDMLKEKGVGYFSAHALRHTVKSLLKEKRIAGKDVRDAFLNHNATDIDATYDHADMGHPLIPATQAWANFVVHCSGAKRDGVIEFPAGGEAA